MRNFRLAPSEWEIMNVIWEINHKTTVREVLDLKYPEGEKAYTTIQTVMNKLVEKGFLNREKIGLVNFYSPKKNRTSSIKSETTHFVKNVFNGSFISLANHLINSGSLSKNEIEQLKDIIDENKKVD